MPVIDLVLETTTSRSARARQVAEMYDVPDDVAKGRCWQGELPIDAEPWNVGLIVGPSGSGKTQIATHLFGPQPELKWGADSVLDDFTQQQSAEEIATVCSAVGFNTIPAWARPYRTLSNGERFRVDLARRLLELPDPIVVDEFTSVVDRQVAQIGAHAVQKYIRKAGRKFIALSCHYDIIDWLQPDWTFEPATMTFARRSLQKRPELKCRLQRTTIAAWPFFAPFHYLNTKKLNTASTCFILSVNDQPTVFASILHRPHPITKGMKAVSRLVTLPDWQGLGLGMAMLDKLGAAYTAQDYSFRITTSHYNFKSTLDRSPNWEHTGTNDPRRDTRHSASKPTLQKSRAGESFKYIGPKMDAKDADALLLEDHAHSQQYQDDADDSSDTTAQATPETKPELIARLRKDGGEAAVSHLWARLRELEAGPPSRTRADAWNLVRKEPGIAPNTELQTPTAATATESNPNAPPDQYDGSARWINDVRWAYDNYDRVVKFHTDGRIETDIKSAKTRPPSEGARSLIKWATHNRTKFIELCGKTFKDDSDTKEQEVRQEEKSIREVREVLRRYLELVPATTA